jgi:hypothetical protein
VTPKDDSEDDLRWNYSNHLVTDFVMMQHGFMKGHSTVTNLSQPDGEVLVWMSI